MKNKEITIYELMGLIKDGKAPKKIKYDDEVFKYDKRHNYISQDGNMLFGDYIYELYYTPSTLNKIVEILPEENDDWEDIEEIDINLGILKMTATEKHISNHINQLIKNQRKIIEKLESKDEK